jgi:DNA-binding transcriptional LysR family regulator
VDIRRLRYFLVLAEELHFGRAASRLAISQPPLSVNIRQLEEAIGVQLFERNSRGVRLTAAGQALVPAARALLESAEAAVRMARDVESGITGQLRLGFVGGMLYRGFPQLLTRFQQRHPALRLNLVELNSKDQLIELVHGSLDAGFVHSARLPGELSSLQFSSERFLACLPQAHPLAQRRTIALHELREERFVVFSRDVSPYYYDCIQSIFSEAGLHPDTRCEARHWLSVVSLVAQGLGAALVPVALRHSRMAGAHFVELEQETILSQTYCTWRTDNERPLLSAFLTAVREEVAGATAACG